MRMRSRKLSEFTVHLAFHDDLLFFLESKKPQLERQLNERTSVKDVIEACGVPHTEVDLILVNDTPVNFAFVIGRECKIDIYGVSEKREMFFPTNRLQAAKVWKFVADGHLGKLVRDLRLLGIDVAYEPNAEDPQLVQLAATESRALLTRDRRLLMHAAVRHGYYLRSQEPFEQTLEVLGRFELGESLHPFSRCLRCNAELQRVSKADVLNRLEPLTKIYYDQFQNCTGCGQIYWSGSHFDKLQDRVEKLRAAMQPEAKSA